MKLTENSEARNKFMDIIASIDNNNKDDRTLQSLVSRSREYLDRRMRSSKFDELNINKDKLLYVNPRLKKGHRASKYIKNYKANSTEKKKRKSIIYMRHLTDNINDNIYKNILGEQYNEKIHDISNKVTTKNEDEKEKVKKKTLRLDEKKLKKLDDLKNFLKLIEVHQQTQYQEDLDPLRPKPNFIRSKNNVKLFKTCLSYDKNDIFFNKKYKLIFDKIKNASKKDEIIYNNFIINSEENKLNFSSNISSKKHINKNHFLKNKKLNKINSDCCNILYHRNINKSSYKSINNNICIYNNNYKQNKNFIRNNIYSLSDYNKKNGKYSKKNNNLINNNISNYINSTRPQTSITSKSNKTKFKKSFQNETTDIGETSSLSLASDINNLKTFSISKKDSYLTKKKIKSNIKYRNENKKKLFKILSEALKKSQKLNKILKYDDISKEKEEEKEKESRIKRLIKKKKTNLNLLINELNLHYDEQKIDLEKLVINNVYNLKKHLQNNKQFRIMNKIANKVIDEDKILSKEVFLESSLAKKLRSRIKTKSDKEFEFLIEKRRYLKSKIMKYKEKNEKDVINNLMKNEVFDFEDIKSLEKIIYKYRTMNHH